MAVDPNDILQLLRGNPDIREAILAIAQEIVPRGTVVGAINTVPLKGYSAAPAPTNYWRKE
jgi:hypothetical protein